MANILITGGTGFIGKNLIINLQKKYKIHKLFVLTRSESFFVDEKDKQYFDKVKFILGDIKYFDTDITFEKIYHLATDANNSPSVNLNTYTENMIDGIVNLKKIAIKNKVKKIIFLSSGAAYMNKSKKKDSEKNLISTDIFDPNNHYANLKLFTEHYLWSSFFTQNISVHIYRVYTVFGYYQNLDSHFFISNLIKPILYNKKMKFLTNCNIIRNIIFIDDLIDLILKLSNKDNKFLIINLGHFDFNLRKIGRLISKSYEKKISFGQKSPKLRKYYSPSLNKLKNKINKKNFFDLDPNKNFLYNFEKTIGWYRGLNLVKIYTK